MDVYCLIQLTVFSSKLIRSCFPHGVTNFGQTSFQTAQFGELCSQHSCVHNSAAQTHLATTLAIVICSCYQEDVCKLSHSKLLAVGCRCG